MKFLANEIIPQASVKYLLSKGWDIISVGLDFSGISDEEVIKISNEQYRTILTHDSDYGELIFKYGFRPKVGVIFIRQRPENPEFTGRLLEKVVNSKNISFEVALTVIDQNSIRQKRF